MIQQYFIKQFEKFLQENMSEILEKFCFWISYYFFITPNYTMKDMDDEPRDWIDAEYIDPKGSDCLHNGVLPIQIAEKIQEKCHEIIYYDYLQPFIDKHPLLCHEMLLEVGIDRKEIECADYKTLIACHCEELNRYIGTFDGTKINQLFACSMSFMMHTYSDQVQIFVEKENRSCIERKYAYDLWGRIEREYKSQKLVSYPKRKSNQTFAAFVKGLGITPKEKELIRKYVANSI